MKVSKSVTVRH